MSPTPEFLYTLRLVPRLRDDEAWTTDDETLVAKHFHYLQRLLDAAAWCWPAGPPTTTPWAW